MHYLVLLIEPTGSTITDSHVAGISVPATNFSDYHVIWIRQCYLYICIGPFILQDEG